MSSQNAKWVERASAVYSFKILVYQVEFELLLLHFASNLKLLFRNLIFRQAPYRLSDSLDTASNVSNAVPNVKYHRLHVRTCMRMFCL